MYWLAAHASFFCLPNNLRVRFIPMTTQPGSRLYMYVWGLLAQAEPSISESSRRVQNESHPLSPLGHRQFRSVFFFRESPWPGLQEILVGQTGYYYHYLYGGKTGKASWNFTRKNSKRNEPASRSTRTESIRSKRCREHTPRVMVDALKFPRRVVSHFSA